MSFQGKPVHETKIALTGGAKEVFGDVPELDQMVSVTIEGRVTGVDHRVDDKSGDLQQIVRVKVVDIDDVSVMTYPRAVTTPSGDKVDPETGEIIDRAESA